MKKAKRKTAKSGTAKSGTAKSATAKRATTKRATAKRAKASRTPLERVRAISAELPEFHEEIAWGAPTFRVKNKQFAMFAEGGNHHGDGRESVWIKASPGNQQLMIKSAPEKFFFPAYVGPSGWVGVYLDKKVDWDEVAALLEDGYRMVAPKRVLAAFDELNK